MFSYYGRKKRLAPKYPEPIHNTIVEPFAGSAAYSLHGDRWRNNVILIEKDERVYNMWKWLQTCTWKEIWNLPLIEEGMKTDDYYLTQEQQDFVGYWIAGGATHPNHTPGKFNGWSDKRKAMVIYDLPKIKHWDIRNCSYEDSPNIVATWFIDPPYQHGGFHYRVGNKFINFPALGNWCQSREGQVIVCENTKADWMDFDEFSVQRGQRHTTTEAIWYRESA